MRACAPWLTNSMAQRTDMSVPHDARKRPRVGSDSDPSAPRTCPPQALPVAHFPEPPPHSSFWGLPCLLPVSQRQRSLGCRQKLRTPRAAPVLPGCVGRRRGKIICAILKFGGTACFWVLEDFAVQCVVSLDHARSPLRQRRAPPRDGRVAGRRLRVSRRPPPGGGKSRRSSGDRQ